MTNSPTPKRVATIGLVTASLLLLFGIAGVGSPAGAATLTPAGQHAPVPGERPPVRDGDQVSPRGDPVPVRRGARHAVHRQAVNTL